MFHIEVSNRIDTLHEALLARLGGPSLGTPSRFAPWHGPTVIVPNLAVGRQLSRRVALRDGVCMGLNIAYLSAWVWQTVARSLGDVASDSPFAPATLTWRLFRLLDEPSLRALHPRLAHFLGSGPAGVHDARRLELAQQVAQLFNRYTQERRAWLQAWAAGRTAPQGLDTPRDAAARADAAWLADLWRRLGVEVPAVHDDPLQRFLQRLQRSPAQPLPPTPAVHIVTPLAMAAQEIEVLQALARSTDVHLYWLNPSQTYWYDQVDDKTMAKLLVQGLTSKKHAARAEHADVGHPLLTGWGRPWQSMGTKLVSMLDDETTHTQVLSAGSPHAHPSSRLTRLKASLWDGEWDPLTTPSVTTAGPVTVDESLEVHRAPTLRRQLEALQERLLARLAQADAPNLSEVLVVMPDIDAAAPLIDAVFGTGTPARTLSYRITGGLSTRDDAGATRVVLDLLGSGGARWTALALDALAQCALVAQRMGWEDGDWDTLNEGLADAGWRMGLNAAHRQSLGLPAQETHTLADAIDRLMLAAMLPDPRPTDPSVARPVAGRLPAPNHTLARRDALDGLVRLERALSDVHREVQQPRTAAQWQAWLLAVMDRFLKAVSPAEREALATLRQTLSAWAQDASLAASKDVLLDAGCAHAWLSAHVREQRVGGVAAGGITFASTSALLGVPMRVVAVLGLDGGSFPRHDTPLEFDLSARLPQADDRRRRLEDRQALLALTLAADEHLWLFHLGRDPHTNEPRPPSVMVDELLHSLAQQEQRTMEDVCAAVVTEHPLHPFDERLFDPHAPPTRRSHDLAVAQGLQARQPLQAVAPRPPSPPSRPPAPAPGTPSVGDGKLGRADDSDPDDAGDDESDHASDSDGDADSVPTDRRHALPFLTAPLPPPPVHDGAVHQLDLPTLQAFFKNPAKAWLAERLGVRLPFAWSIDDEDDRFAIDKRVQRPRATAWANAMREGATPLSLREAVRADVVYPQGPLGDRMIDEDLLVLQQRAEQAGPLPTLAPAMALEMTVDVTMPPQGRVDAPMQRWVLSLELGHVPTDADQTVTGVMASSLQAHHRLTLWIQHLAMAVISPSLQRRSRLLTGKGNIEIKPVDATTARAHLRTLVQLMADGQCAPLPFISNTSWIACSQGMPAARRAFNQVPWGQHDAPPCDADQPELRWAWRGRGDMVDDHAFESVAQTVFAPLLQALEAGA
jgi:exodeoxyribonuclease V gamma subunit